ncbi:peptide chain release factor 2 [Peptoniphilus sp. KCTC 25270]|uniref:peptide chain release factor 2 n=1 Tax=Peptoniphilus sp. KCTC 25270 TaxID=2897414 RepID=UPI001E345BFB|nr:peptide chain release factor 2 [Peptoniphilus sp. KCTC 25270]MCD1146688.1 peptide chain release factor 2 [Peptoniphilus sp. KCTC 25270]
MEQNIFLDRERIDQSRDLVERLGKSLDIETLRAEAKAIEEKTMETGFWDDSQAAQKVIKKQNSLKDRIDKYDNLMEKIEEANVLLELMEEEDDYSFYSTLKENIAEVEKDASVFKLETLLNGEYDDNDVILSIHAGAGGTEAQDWADMLLRMYRRYAEKKGYKVELLDLLKEDEAGIKSATLQVSGPHAYGYIKAEKGVHRLVRISPFDAAKKRHTSFASVDVYPVIDEDTDVEINNEDIKVDTYRASGAGGQHVNTTDSAVRITHIPTGIVVQCQNERSQIQNRETAMNMLKAKLIALKEEEQKEKIEDLQGNYSQIAWGSQIRSYVFHPYTLVKDHRTNEEVGDVSRVMDGDLDPFINAYLEENADKKN